MARLLNKDELAIELQINRKLMDSKFEMDKNNPALFFIDKTEAYANAYFALQIENSKLKEELNNMKMAKMNENNEGLRCSCLKV